MKISEISVNINQIKHNPDFLRNRLSFKCQEKIKNLEKIEQFLIINKICVIKDKNKYLIVDGNKRFACLQELKKEKNLSAEIIPVILFSPENEELDFNIELRLFMFEMNKNTWTQLEIARNFTELSFLLVNSGYKNFSKFIIDHTSFDFGISNVENLINAYSIFLQFEDMEGFNKNFQNLYFDYILEILKYFFLSKSIFNKKISSENFSQICSILFFLIQKSIDENFKPKDFALRLKENTEGGSFLQELKYARQVSDLGLKRYWVSEKFYKNFLIDFYTQISLFPVLKDFSYNLKNDFQKLNSIISKIYKSLSEEE